MTKKQQRAARAFQAAHKALWNAQLASMPKMASMKAPSLEWTKSHNWSVEGPVVHFLKVHTRKWDVSRFDCQPVLLRNRWTLMGSSITARRIQDNQKSKED